MPSENRKKRIAILGSTGSVGENAVKVAGAMKDRIEVVAIAANSNAERLAEQAKSLNCRIVSVTDCTKKEKLAGLLPGNCEVLCGDEGLLEIVKRDDIDFILCAIVGTGGLLPCIETLKSGKTLALASKEVLVMAGHLVMELAQKHGGRIIPVDSEHSAIFQCLQSGNHREIEKLILTASGGPFRKMSPEEMGKITLRDALCHPTWNMGPKITLDSASLMNKALEMIEAHFLFNVSPEQIDVLLHPQSLVHSMVEFSDGAVIAQMSIPDMRFPIQYSFTWPERIKTNLPRLELEKIGFLEFEPPDRKRFPSLDFAYHAMKTGKTMPAVLNAANEIAVERFRKGEIRFPDIWKIIENTMEMHECLEDLELNAILNADAWARNHARKLGV